MRPAIHVENLSKRFRLGARQFGSYRTLRESLVAAARAPFNRLRALVSRSPVPEDPPADAADLWALDDVSLEVRHGEVVGLIGRNGAGKSTLLKVLSQITEPTKGRVTLHGRVGSLLEVGTGFHPELTGRENIYLNGSILGMSRREINRKFDEIVAFAEMDRFLDTPVKRYSSGMYVRLAFAVAAHLDLEILLIDEVLAVGDLEFQKKCLYKMETIAQGGRTVVFVSHNLGLIYRLCSKAILLEGGRVAATGPAPEIVSRYLSASLRHHGDWRAEPSDGRSVSVRRIFTTLDGETPAGIIAAEQTFRVCIEYEVTVPVPDFVVGFQLRNAQGVLVLTTIDKDTANWPERSRQPGRYRSTCQVPAHMLAPGTYFLTCAAAIINQQTFDTRHDIVSFEVSESGCIRTRLNDRREGVVTPIFDWRIDRTN